MNTADGQDMILPADTYPYQAIIGLYQLAPDRQLLLTRKGLGKSALYFYHEGDSLVRLLPRPANQFTSSRGELFTIRGTDLYLTDTAGTVHQAQRIHPYREELINIPSADHTLAGSLLIPDSTTPHPAVVLYHLANVHERDYYRIYADHFARNGIAALIYDKRGHGASTGDPLGSQLYPLIEDADAAYRFLQAHPQIDSQRIGVWGMSNGGWVDLGVAVWHPETAFVMNLSASGVPPSRQEQIRRVNVSRVAGASYDQLSFLDSFWQMIFAFLIRGEWSADLEMALRRIQREPTWRDLLKDTGGGWLLETPIDDIKREYGSAWQDGGFDPTPYYAQLRCPILCLWGQEDTVLPVAESILRIQEVLHAHPDWSIQTLPRANHLLYLNRPSVDEATNEAMHDQLQDVHYPSGLFDNLVAWSRQRLHL